MVAVYRKLCVLLDGCMAGGVARNGLAGVMTVVMVGMWGGGRGGGAEWRQTSDRTTAL